MVKVKKYIVVYAAVLAACYALMPVVCAMAYKERGYFAIGGEWLVPVVAVMLLEVVRLALVQILTSADINKKKVGK